MIQAALTLALVCGQAQIPVPTESPIPGPQLVTKMLARYHDAKSLSATIHMTQTAMGKSITFDTSLAYVRPQKIYFVQKRSDDPSYLPQLISDSVSFAYTAPSNVDNKRIKFFKETAHPAKAGQLNIEEMWAALEPQVEGGDDSLSLVSMISRLYDLKLAIPQLKTCLNKGKIMINNKQVNDIEGVWKATGYGQTGTYQLYVTDEGEIVRQVLNMAFGVKAQWLVNHNMAANAFPNGIQTTTTWDITESLDQTLDDTLFTLPSNLSR